MSQCLLNKVAIVTGLLLGIGRVIVILYAHEGAKVVCSDLVPSQRSNGTENTIEDAHKLIEKAGSKAIFHRTDVSACPHFPR